VPGEVSFQGHARPLPSSRAARVLVPLCRIDLATPVPGESVVSRAWAALQAAGFKQYVPFVRGPAGHEEIVIVLSEGVVSWPVRQLTPDTVDFLEVQAL
jgi:hypothetical protein